MRRVLAAVVLLALACGRPSAPAARGGADAAARSTPIADLRFNDEHLQSIADRLARKARSRGIDTCVGANRAECLLWLEASVGEGQSALDRVNRLVAQLTLTDTSEWAELRQHAERDFRRRDDPVGIRVRDMLTRWQREKSAIALRYISSNYKVLYISWVDWERRFHDFVRERPADAATWGWLIAQSAHATSVRQQYGQATPEMAYRFYLELTGMGDGREARALFSVAGAGIREAPVARTTRALPPSTTSTRAIPASPAAESDTRRSRPR